MKTDTETHKIEEFLTRGVENIFPSQDFVRSKLTQIKSGEKLSMYLGIDPTGPTLHLGHAIALKKLGQFQKLGHQIILLMGDFTAMIGDPTDKTAARKKLTREEVMENLAQYRKQAEKFISFSGENPALLKFNSEWLSKMSFTDVLELTSLMTVDQMLKRDMFAKRREEGQPIYIHEFLYPLMQGYDSVAMDVDGEVGGNDQTFNMLTGRDLLKTLKNKEKFVIALKLLTDSSGKKMGKTEGNMIALDQTPDDMFGKVMSWSDELIIPGFEIVTDVPLEEIETMKKSLTDGENPRNLKARLAREIVALCVGGSKEEAEATALVAQAHFEETFSQGGVPDDIAEVEADAGILLMDVFLAQGIVTSKTDARRLFKEGAIMNMDTEEKITDPTLVVAPGTYKIGKRRFVKVVVK